MDRLEKERLKVYWGIRPWTRHSLVLIVAGIVYIALGFAYYNDLLSTERQDALVFILALIPLDLWGVIFMLGGLLVLLSAKWPRRSEKWGYVILTGLSSAWASAYALGIAFGKADLVNLPAVLTWGLVAFIWWAISGLVNPPQTVAVVPDGRS